MNKPTDDSDFLEPESGDSWAELVDLSGRGDESQFTQASGANDDSFALATHLQARPDGNEVDDSLADETPLPENIGGYQVGPRLGRGGMGEVFLAEHRSMGRTVALKILPQRWIHRAGSVDRFYEEIRAASRLMHPNIVTAFDAGQADGIHFLAMEYVDGVTLSQAIRQEGPMSIGDATSVTRQAAFALHHAHSAGIIHRDVKPGNLMRSVDGTIKLLDLGLARFSHQWHSSYPSDSKALPLNRDSGPASKTEDESDSSQPGSSLSVISSPRRSLLGTLAFISPEQLEDPESADARSDQYSLGATLFFLLVGHPPFHGETIEQIYGHRHGDIPDLMSHRQDIDLTLANIVNRMLAKDPAERYGSMDEVARAMAPYDNDRSTPAWVLDFSQRKINDDVSTAGESSQTATTKRPQALSVLGVDLGMTHAATAVGLSNGKIQAGWPLASETGPQSLFRLAVSERPGTARTATGDSGAKKLLFGQPAYELRRRHPRRVSHCQMMYFDRTDMGRRIGKRICPPVISTALCLRHLVGNTLMHHVLAERAGLPDSDSIGEKGLPGKTSDDSIDSVLGTAWHRHPDWPEAVAITVPTCYDQLHRRAIHTAAQIAGLPSIRLVDRSMAVMRFAMEQLRRESTAPSQPTALSQPQAGVLAKQSRTKRLENEQNQVVLYVGLTGQALDVAVLRRRGHKIEQLGSAGHWRHGSIVWTSRLVELISSKLSNLPSILIKPESVGPSGESLLQRDKLIYAAKVQMAGERAMNSLLLLPEAKVEIQHHNQTQSVTVSRQEWLHACKDLMTAIEDGITEACRRSKVDISSLEHCLILSPILRLPSIRQRVLACLNDETRIDIFDYTDAARGAVACVAAEMPGQRGGFLPVRCRTSHSVGFVVADSRGKRKILPIIGRGTPTPARSNRQLGGRIKNNQLTLALVESSGVNDDGWQTLGRHSILVEGGEPTAQRRLGFEVDINGLLSVHMERPDLGRTVQLPPLPQLAVASDQWQDWQEWVADHA